MIYTKYQANACFLMESVLVSLIFHLASVSVGWGEMMHIPVMTAFWERSWEERKVRKISLEEE